MADPLEGGTWLLIDAAGPVSTIGLIRSYRWLSRESHEGDFLEWLQPATTRCLDKASLELACLSGVIYGSGPGSTLGLRLAAMFLRTLLNIPAHRHWRCFQYNNLELALMEREDGRIEAVAPWRRDRLHHVKLTETSPLRFTHAGIDPKDAEKKEIPGIILGRRPPGPALKVAWENFPHAAITTILHAQPTLLLETPQPVPYLAETPEFQQWAPKRHTKQ